MGRLGALGLCTGLFCVAAAAHVDAAPRGGFFAPGSAPRAPQIMLYFSHSVGSGAGAESPRPTFGLRVQQVRQAFNSGDPQSGDPMQHREFINLQMGHSSVHWSDLRVKLGNRVTYDVANRRFGSPASRFAMQIGTPSLRSGVAISAQPRPFAARGLPVGPAGFGVGSGARDIGRDIGKDNSSIHEIAEAAIAAVSPTRFTSVQRPIAQRQGGLAAIAAAQRMQAPAIR